MTNKLNAKAAAIMASVAALAVCFQTPAEAQVWKVGSTYVIRHQHLDLDRPADRLALLVQVERAGRETLRGRPDQGEARGLHRGVDRRNPCRYAGQRPQRCAAGAP